MALDLSDSHVFGPALPEPFVKLQLEALLKKKKLLPTGRGKAGKALQSGWESYRRKLRRLGERGGDRRVLNHVLEPLAERLGYARVERSGDVLTREGAEDGGWRFIAEDGRALRVFPVPLGVDIDAPNRRGRAFRYSPARIAQRVLLAEDERVGLVSDGEELRLLIADPVLPASHLAVRLDRSGGWRGARRAPDSYRLVLALAAPDGVAEVPSLVDAARLAQSAVTDSLRSQARDAVTAFMQEVLDHPDNAEALAGADLEAQAATLWAEGLVFVYRLLFIFKLESSPDPARRLSFASESVWRNTFSPNLALAPIARRVLDEGAETGRFLEDGLRTLFALFANGLSLPELQVSPLGGALFGHDATPTLDDLSWGEHAIAKLLDKLLWTPGAGKAERQRVHYGALDVEDLGRVYEALLELEPGVASEPMCRLRRAKLEVVVPAAQGEPYRDAETKRSGKTKTTVELIEEIPAGRFYLRVGLGRKATGSYYTPHGFVRFLVQETLGPQLAERSPDDEPNPSAILALRVIDPAMGSGHFLVEACRYLGDALYAACRLCDERALALEAKAERAKTEAEAAELRAEARELWRRVEALPDPDDELLSYLPSRAPEGADPGLSQRAALALCRRLVAVHCLYGVDKNPLAAELAKVSLWLEAHAEGMPLTFVDHRLRCGDSLTGPMVEHLRSFPGTGEPLDDLLGGGLEERLLGALGDALQATRALEASVGTDLSDLADKRASKAHLDETLAPFARLAAAWSGGVLLGGGCDDPGYKQLVEAVAAGGTGDEVLAARPALRQMVAAGAEGLPYDLVFPEVFYASGRREEGGFDAVLGNPPWDALQPLAKEFFAAFDLRVIDAPTRRERAEVEERLLADATTKAAWDAYLADIEGMKGLIGRLTEFVGKQAGGRSSGAVSDVWQVFAERGAHLLRPGGRVGWVLPSAFHANQSATGIRSLYLEHLALTCCFSFENRRKLFDIHRSFKFAPIVAERDPAGTQAFDCAFYLHDLEWLFSDREPMRYTLDFVRKTGGEYLSFLELRSPEDAAVAARAYMRGSPLGSVLESLGVRTGEEIHMSKGSHRFTDTVDVTPNDPRDPEVTTDLRARGYLPLHEGKTFHQYDDRWSAPPRYLVARDALADKPAWREAAQYYRLAFRDIASATNERTGIFCLLPPGFVFGNTAPCERSPKRRRNADVLTLLAVANSHPFDWTVRQNVAAHVNLFILNGCPFPPLDRARERFLAHAALRLSCNHAGYAALWRDQLGDAWREDAPPLTWPVLTGEDGRWTLRAAVDAVVAAAYGLDRALYAHLLASFSHASHPNAPARCLAAFDALERDGFPGFAARLDPYDDVPLNRAAARPVLDLLHAPGPAADTGRPRRDARGQYQLLAPDDGPLFRQADRRDRDA